jgi:hypothetical protein
MRLPVEQISPTPRSMVQAWKDYVPAVDRHLPVWARRTDPIVRRHLGIYWKMLPLDVTQLVRLYLLLVALVLVSAVLPVVLPLMFILLPVSLVMLPLALYSYARVLLATAAFTTRMIVDEQANNTLNLLRTTPLTLGHIVLSKAAAGVWRQIEDLSLLLVAVLLLTLPVIGLQYAAYFPYDDGTLGARLALIVGLAVSLVRLVLEPFMIAALAILMGALIPVRTTALVALGVTVFFYFLLVNFLRLMPLTPTTFVVVEFILPLALPLLIAGGALRLAVWALRQD